MKKIEINLIESVQNVLKNEAQALISMSEHIDSSFENIISYLYGCKGRVIVCGVGKSGIVGRKLVATFNSSGTPSLFMSASDAAHGDLGMILRDDVVLMISKSGDTQELKRIIPFIKNKGNKLIAMVSNLDSYLAINSDLFIFLPVEREAGPYDLAPTTSTTLQMVVGDAIAMTLCKMKDFTGDDFLNLHPGGTIGERLSKK